MSHVIFNTSLQLQDFAQNFERLQAQHSEMKSLWHTSENQILIEVHSQSQDFFLSMMFSEDHQLKLNLQQSSEVQGNHIYQAALKDLSEWVLSQAADAELVTHTLGAYAPVS